MTDMQITVMDDFGLEVWTGPLAEFADDNEMDARALLCDLRALHEGRPEPVIIGGGAAPVFYVSLL